MVKDIKLKNVKELFQKNRKDDVRKINELCEIFLFAGKSRQIVELGVCLKKHLVIYKKCSFHIHNIHSFSQYSLKIHWSNYVCTFIEKVPIWEKMSLLEISLHREFDPTLVVQILRLSKRLKWEIFTSKYLLEERRFTTKSRSLLLVTLIFTVGHLCVL